MLFLLFKHPSELAALMHKLWNTIFYNRVTEAMFDVSVSAIFISVEAGGMENEPVEEVFGAEFQYHKVLFTLNLIKLTPVCFIESMTMTVERKGIMRITKVAFVSQMLNKLHDYVCLDFPWPDGVSYTTMLMSAMFSYSMFSDYQFEHAYEAPIGLDCTAAWFVFELSMLEHAFVCYCFEIYLQKAEELDDLPTVKLYFLAFPSHPQSIFSLDADIQYGIHSIIKAVNDERFIKKHHSATLANSDWCIEYLEHALNVPRLGLLTLPEFGDEPPALLLPPILTPVALTPISALFTTAGIEFSPASTPGPLTPRRLEF